MILLMNVFIEDKVYAFGPENCLEILKFTLSSYSKLKINHAIVNIEFENAVEDTILTTIEFVKEQFETCDMSTTRIATKNGWLNLLNMLQAEFGSKELVFFCCNHDHPMLSSIDKELDEFKSQVLPTFPFASFAFSHWPEEVARHNRNVSLKKYGLVKKAFNVDSIQILTLEHLQYWFENHISDTAWLPRSDPPYKVAGKDAIPVPPNASQVVYVPYQEKFAHFEGYGHAKPSIDFETCPPLSLKDPCPYSRFNSMQKICLSTSENTIKDQISIGNRQVENILRVFVNLSTSLSVDKQVLRNVLYLNGHDPNEALKNYRFRIYVLKYFYFFRNKITLYLFLLKWAVGKRT